MTYTELNNDTIKVWDKMTYTEFENYWSIEFIAHNGMYILCKEFDRVLRSDTFEACTDYILQDEGAPDACIAYDDIKENMIYPTDYFYN